MLLIAVACVTPVVVIVLCHEAAVNNSIGWGRSNAAAPDKARSAAAVPDPVLELGMSCSTTALGPCRQYYKNLQNRSNSLRSHAPIRSPA